MWLTVTDCHSVVTDRSSDCGLLFLATVRAGVFGISSGEGVGGGGGGLGGGGEVQFHAGPTGLPLCSKTAPWVSKMADSRRPSPAAREPSHESEQKGHQPVCLPSNGIWMSNMASYKSIDKDT